MDLPSSRVQWDVEKWEEKNSIQTEKYRVSKTPLGQKHATQFLKQMKQNVLILVKYFTRCFKNMFEKHRSNMLITRYSWIKILSISLLAFYFWITGFLQHERSINYSTRVGAELLKGVCKFSLWVIFLHSFTANWWFYTKKCNLFLPFSLFFVVVGLDWESLCMLVIVLGFTHFSDYIINSHFPC